MEGARCSGPWRFRECQRGQLVRQREGGMRTTPSETPCGGSLSATFAASACAPPKSLKMKRWWLEKWPEIERWPFRTLVFFSRMCEIWEPHQWNRKRVLLKSRRFIADFKENAMPKNRMEKNYFLAAAWSAFKVLRRSTENHWKNKDERLPTKSIKKSANIREEIPLFSEAANMLQNHWICFRKSVDE